jgi:hypothetical protein
MRHASPGKSPKIGAQTPLGGALKQGKPNSVALIDALAKPGDHL